MYIHGIHCSVSYNYVCMYICMFILWLLFAFSPESHNPYNLEVGSAVQYMDFNQYGVIKWIGTISDSRDVYAGIEMVRRYKTLRRFINESFHA